MEDIFGAGMHLVDYDNAQKMFGESQVCDHLPNRDATGIVTFFFLEPVNAENTGKFYPDIH
jgi:hypothetical protein